MTCDKKGQTCGASCWRVCYQWGLPRLVLLPVTGHYSAADIEKPGETPAEFMNVIKDTPSAAGSAKPGENTTETSDITKETPEHMDDTSNQVKNFKCENCDYINETERVLWQHIARKHKYYQCEKVFLTALPNQT